MPNSKPILQFVVIAGMALWSYSCVFSWVNAFRMVLCNVSVGESFRRIAFACGIVGKFS